MRTDSGEVYFYNMVETTVLGKMPTYNYTLNERLGYEARNIGVIRQNVALQQDARVDALIRVPIRYGLENCRALLVPYSHTDSNVYKVISTREMTDENGLTVLDVELERLEGINANEIINISNDAI